MKIERLTANVFVATELRGCNAGFVVTSEGVVLIDVPIDPDNARLLAAEIAKWGKPLYIVNTEFHFDHNMNNSLFNVPVIASEITRDLILERNTEAQLDWRRTNLYIHPTSFPSFEEYRRGIPTITFTDRMKLHLGEHTFQIILLPGHSPGQTSVYVPEERGVFCSDNISAGGGGTGIDRGMPYKWLESVDVLRTLDIDFIQTGHGPLVTNNIKECLDKTTTNLRASIDAVKKAKRDELSIEETIEFLEEMFPPPVRPDYEDFNPNMGNLPGHVLGFRGGLARHLYEVIDMLEGYQR